MSGPKPTAKVEQILLWYDQPEILLLSRSNLEYIVAVSSAASDNDDSQFVGASMTLKLLSEYQNGKCDLRYAMAHANLRRYWTFSFTGEEAEVELARIKKSDSIVAQSLPDSGFFAREHDTIDVAK